MSGPLSSAGWNDQHSGAYDARISELSRERPFWDYEKLANALTQDSIYVSAFYVAWRLGEMR